MRLAFCLFKYFPYGGLQRDFYAIAEECVARGYTIDVFTLAWEGDSMSGVTIHVLPIKALMNHQRYKKFAQCVYQQLTKTAYGAVIGFNKMPYLDIYFAADPCFVAMADRLRSFWYRTISPRFYLFSRFESAVLARDSSSKILALSEIQKRDFIQYYSLPASRFTLLPPWILKNRQRPSDAKEIRAQLRKEFSLKDDDYLVLHIGSGFRMKGVSRALSAIKELPEAIRKKVHYYVIGQDKKQAFVDLAEKIGLQSQVRFLGGRKDIPRFLFAADMLFHPAYAESAGIVLIEAIVAGLPVLTTASCGYAKYVTEAQAGQVIPEPYSQTLCNQRLLMFLTSVEQRQQWQSNALDYASHADFYSMPVIAANEIQQYIACNQTRYNKGSYLWQHRKLSPFHQEKDNVFNQIMSLQGETYRKVAKRHTLRFSHHDKVYFAKLHFGVGWLEIVKNWLQVRQPILGAENEYFAAKRLAEAGLNTLSIVAYGYRGKNPARKQSFIISEELRGTENLENILKMSQQQPITLQQKRQIIRQVAEITRKMHNNGVNHRDYYACHLLVNLDKATGRVNFDNLKIHVIDLHRAQLRQHIPLRWIIKDLGSLFFSIMRFNFSVRDYFYFIKYYEGCSMRDSWQHKKHFWSRVAKRANQLHQKAMRKNLYGEE